MRKKKTIVIIGTGGTLASIATTRDAAHYGQAETSIDTLVQKLPEINQLATVKTEQLVQINSENMTESIWLQLAHRVKVLTSKDDVDAIVISHGTDTMEETAYFLNLVMPTKKPIILTGAMRPSNSLSADGLRNLYQAIVVGLSDQSTSRGVLLVLNDVIHQARDATKININSVGAFDSPNYGKVGHIHDGLVFFYRDVSRLHTYQSAFDIDNITALPCVNIIYGAVGNDRLLVDACINAKVQGIVSAGVGMGYQPSITNQALIDARKAGISVVRCTRVKSGIVTMEKHIDEPNGFIPSGSLNPQKARILLAVALSKTNDLAALRQIFNTY